MTLQIKSSNAHKASRKTQTLLFSWAMRFSLIGAIIGSLTIFIISDPHFTDRVAVVLRAILGGFVGCILGIAGGMITMLLNDDHSDDIAELKWLNETFRFTEEIAADLAKQINFHEATTPVTGVTEQGTYFSRAITAIGATGKSIDVTFVWIKNKDGMIRLVAVIPMEEKDISR